jgi:hypothetical protein
MIIAALGANLLTVFVLLLTVDLLSFAPDHRATLTGWLRRTVPTDLAASLPDSGR